jgi:hypothetical protein
MSPIKHLLVTAALILTVTEAADGQQLRVAVTAFEDGRAITGALVSVFADRDLYARTETDSAGVAVLNLPQSPDFDLAVSAFGYKPVLATISRPGDQEVLDLSVVLEPQPVLLDPVVVSERGAKLPTRGRQLFHSFGKVGYETDRQRATHTILRQTDPPHGSMECARFSEQDRAFPYARDELRRCRVQRG